MNAHAIYDHRIKMFYNDETQTWSFNPLSAALFTFRCDAFDVASSLLTRCPTLHLGIIELGEDFQPVNPQGSLWYRSLQNRANLENQSQFI